MQQLFIVEITMTSGAFFKLPYAGDLQQVASKLLDALISRGTVYDQDGYSLFEVR